MKLLEHTDQRKKALSLLGLPPDADRKDVRRIFCKLAFGCHPDLHRGDPEKERRFRRLNEAYQTIMANLDLVNSPESGRNTPSHPGPKSAPSRRKSASSHRRSKPSRRKGASHSRESASPPRGRDLRFRLHLDPARAAQGGEVSLRFRRPVPRAQGTATEPAILRVYVPPRLNDGDQIRIAGHGAPGGFGGVPGDLYVTVSIADRKSG